MEDDTIEFPYSSNELNEEKRSFIKESIGEYRKIDRVIKLAKFAINETIANEIMGRKLSAHNILTLILFIKMVNRTHSVVILVENGLIADSMVLMRGLVEQLIMLKLFCDNKDNVEVYGKKSLKMLNKMVNSYIQNKVFEENKTEHLIKIKESLTPLLDELKDLDEKNIDQLAIKAGLGEIYEKYYRFFCEETHSSLATLTGYLFMNDNKEKIVGVKYRNMDRGKSLLCKLFVIISKAVVFYCEFMKLGKLELPYEFENFKLS